MTTKKKVSISSQWTQLKRFIFGFGKKGRPTLKLNATSKDDEHNSTDSIDISMDEYDADEDNLPVTRGRGRSRTIISLDEAAATKALPEHLSSEVAEKQESNDAAGRPTELACEQRQYRILGSWKFGRSNSNCSLERDREEEKIKRPSFIERWKPRLSTIRGSSDVGRRSSNSSDLNPTTPSSPTSSIDSQQDP